MAIFYYKVAIFNSPLPPLVYQSEKKIKIGYIVYVKLKQKLVKGFIYSQCEKPKFLCEKIEKIDEFYFSLKYIEIIDFLSKYYICSISQASTVFVPQKTGATFKKTIVKINLTLSKEQKKAYEFLNKHKISLLFGDTGSGKTEIYFKFFEEAINNNKSAIFLVPEISLTPQLTKRLNEKFNNLVALWHSKIPKKQKELILQKIYNGEIKIVIGTRSALFLPLQNLGLIVVDEEHDDSFKSNKKPKYNAKDMAIYMAKKLNIKIILGSATPSINSYKNYPYYRLKKTYYTTKKEYIFLKNQEDIHPQIFEELSKTLQEKKQAIFFLPTRANFKYIFCQDCGKGIKCPFCEVGMSLHKEKNALLCHYCNFSSPIPKFCPECKSTSLIVNRIGTAQVEEILKKNFPNHIIKRFDKDSITTRKKLEQILKEFNEKKIDILVGTQMLSKGHDYHQINLAIILDIDTILNMADFRARYKALSLVTQVSGRVARKGEGKVLIQTSNADFFNTYIKDFEKFLKDEEIFLKDLYPPYKKFLKAVIFSKNPQKAKEKFETTYDKIKTILTNEVEIVGAKEAPIRKIGGIYRYIFLFRSSKVKELLKIGHFLKNLGADVDMDPINFY